MCRAWSRWWPIDNMQNERQNGLTSRLARAARRFHRDQRGGALDYVMVLAFVGIPLIMLMDKLFQILSDYFAMIAYYVTWPFL